MTIKVSVVVPVYNPGIDIERCLDSLLTQSMAAAELELIFVDDGSTDDTLSRLRELEREHEQIQVISIPNSGWPGKPRNVGTDAASGTYVMYVDQDDRLDPEALARMYDLGSVNHADIVLGKVTSDFRGVHHYLYREQRPRCTVYDARLINSQTPHKMLRRQFLLEHGIRYPEGRRRLEDQLFITKAYFAAENCSIVADYVCYRYLRRTEGSNAGEARIDPPSYYENLRDVLDVVDQHTAPGPVRDHFYRRFMRVELLGKLSGQKVIKTRLERGDLWLEPIRRLAEERFPPAVDAGLPTTARVRAHLMRHGTFAEVKELTSRTRRVQPEVTAVPVPLGRGPAGNGRVRLQVTGTLVEDGLAVRLQPDGEGGWLLPESITGAGLDPALRRVDDPAAMVADVVVSSRANADEWFVDRPLTVGIEPQGEMAVFSIQGEVVLDPSTAAGGSALVAGRHDLSLRLDALGLNRLKPLKVADAEAGHATTLAVLGHQPRTLLAIERSGRLRLEVGVSGRALRQRIAPVTAAWENDRLVVGLDAAWCSSRTLKAELRSDRGAVTGVRLTANDEQARVWCSSGGAVRPGRYQLRIHLPRAGAVDIEEPVVVPRSPVQAVTHLVQRVAGRLRRRWRAVRRGPNAPARTDEHESLTDDQEGR